MAKRRWSPLRVLLTLLAVALLAIAAWTAWLYVGTNLVAAAPTAAALEQAEQAIAEDTGDAETEAQLPLPSEGEPMWVLEIPSIDVRVPVIAGTTEDDLARGVGWYPTTNLPGEPGNVGIAGHGLMHGKPFERLTELAVGDELTLTTRLATYTYTVRVAPADLTVDTTDGWVLDPVPGQDFDPHESVLTLTTDQDLVATDDRSVAFAVLTHQESR